MVLHFGDHSRVKNPTVTEGRFQRSYKPGGDRFQSGSERYPAEPPAHPGPQAPEGRQDPQAAPDHLPMETRIDLQHAVARFQEPAADAGWGPTRAGLEQAWPQEVADPCLALKPI